jgi:hypothetical protein
MYVYALLYCGSWNLNELNSSAREVRPSELGQEVLPCDQRTDSSRVSKHLVEADCHRIDSAVELSQGYARRRRERRGVEEHVETLLLGERDNPFQIGSMAADVGLASDPK